MRVDLTHSPHWCTLIGSLESTQSMAFFAMAMASSAERPSSRTAPFATPSP